MILSTDMAPVGVHMALLPGAATPVDLQIMSVAPITVEWIGGKEIVAVKVVKIVKIKSGALWIASLIHWLRGSATKMLNAAGVWTKCKVDSTVDGGRVATSV